jgi:hypothetical protein
MMETEKVPETFDIYSALTRMTARVVLKTAGELGR